MKNKKVNEKSNINQEIQRDNIKSTNQKKTWNLTKQVTLKNTKSINRKKENMFLMMPKNNIIIIIIISLYESTARQSPSPAFSTPFHQLPVYSRLLQHNLLSHRAVQFSVYTTFAFIHLLSVLYIICPAHVHFSSLNSN